METFFTFLSKRVDDCSSLLCVGLDPHPSDLPVQSAEAARDYCLHLIKETAQYAAAFKPNAAFFEAYGPDGWSALKDVIKAVQERSERMGSLIPVILDAKRGDIASSAEGYAKSAFENLGTHAITLNPYLGRDSLDPFLAYKEKGVFLLCKTSNAGAADVQDLPIAIKQLHPGEGQKSMALYEHIAMLAKEWNTGNNIGLVVGATQLEALEKVRHAAPDMWLLVPGVGIQGGDLDSALKIGVRSDGKGMLVTVSRSLARAENPRLEAASLRDAMLENVGLMRKTKGKTIRGDTFPQARLADDLLAAGCIKFGEFTLKSGLKSPIYIDLRQIISHPGLLARVCSAYLPLLEKLTFDRIAGLPYAALPIATGISLDVGCPMIYPRREAKEYGTKAAIEGEFTPGEMVVVIDDLATTGGSKFEAVEKLTAEGLKVKDIVVFIDRESGARAALEKAGLHLYAVMTISQMLDHWEKTGKVEKKKIDITRAFLAKGG